MRIVCDNCGAKYQISDDKVRNKVFKIRCKRCAHVIVVRSQGDEEEAGLAGGADEDSTRVGNHPAPEPAAAREPSQEAPLPAADAVWYIVINREQVGPLTKAQIQGHLRQGEVDAEAFTWREGMPDWTRLGAIPEFASLFPAPAPVEPAAPAPAPAQQRSPRPAAAAAPEPAPFGGNDGGFGALDQDDDVIASSHPAPGPEPVAAAHDPRVSSHQLRNQRNENSVLFSLDSLAAEVDRPSSVRSTGGSDASGLIDISALAGGGGRSGGGDDPFGGGGGFAPISAAPVGSAMPILVKRRGMSTGAVVAIVAAVVLVVGGGAAAAIWYIKNQQPATPVPPVASGSDAVRVGVTPATAAASAAPSAAPSVAVASAAPSAPASEVAAAPPSAPESLAAAVPSAPATEAEEPAPTRRKRTTTKRTRASTRIARTRTPDPEDDPPARAPTPPATPRTAAPKKRGNSELDGLLNNLGNNNQNGGARQGGGDSAPRNRNAAPAGDPMLPEKLSRQQVLQVVTKNAGSIRSCGQGGGGTVTVSMLIGRSGNVDDAKATGGQAGTPVGSCVEGKVRSFRFPQFSGEPMRINMPFAL